MDRPDHRRIVGDIVAKQPLRSAWLDKAGEVAEEDGVLLVEAVVVRVEPGVEPEHAVEHVGADEGAGPVPAALQDFRQRLDRRIQPALAVHAQAVLRRFEAESAKVEVSTENS